MGFDNTYVVTTCLLNNSRNNAFSSNTTTALPNDNITNTSWQFLFISSLGNTILSFPNSSTETHLLWETEILLFSSWLLTACKELFCLTWKHSGKFWQGTSSEIYFKPYIIRGFICLWKIGFLIVTGIYFSIFLKGKQEKKSKMQFKHTKVQ